MLIPLSLIGRPAESDDEESALAMALRRIEFLEQQFTKTEESIKIIREQEELPTTYLVQPRPENNGRNLVAVLERLDELEFQYGWIQNSVTEIQEYTGLEQGYFPRLPYRWEGPPPATFRYRGKEYYDVRPAVVTPSGRAGTTSVILETTKEDGDWEVVARKLASRDFGKLDDDRGKRIRIGMFKLLLGELLINIMKIRVFLGPGQETTDQEIQRMIRQPFRLRQPFTTDSNPQSRRYLF